MYIALPNRNHSFTCSLFYHKGGDHAFGRDDDIQATEHSFRQQFAGAAALIPELRNELTLGKPSDICAVSCNVWNHDDKVLLVGDAAHAIVPFFAMGMNAGFEDCTVFGDLLDAHEGDLGAVIRAYGGRRKPDTDAIGAMSLENFKSIGRSHRSDYHNCWALERRLWQRYPDQWIPLYVMIAFSKIPLAEVQRRSEVQAALVQEIVREFGEDVGLDDANVLAWLAPRLEEQLPAVRELA